MFWLLAPVLLFVPSIQGCSVTRTDILPGDVVNITSPNFPNKYPYGACEYLLFSAAATSFNISCDVLDFPARTTLSGATICDEYSYFRFKREDNRYYKYCKNANKSPRNVRLSIFYGQFLNRKFWNPGYKGFRCTIKFLGPLQAATTASSAVATSTSAAVVGGSSSTAVAGSSSTAAAGISTTAAPVSASTPTSNTNCPQCGIRQAGRIVGGTEATLNEYPWQVMLVDNATTSWYHFCGGTLIAPNVVVTAAHCINDQKSNEVVVFLGDHSKQQVEQTQVVTGVSKIIKHSGYNTQTNDNDIALLILDKSVTYSTGIQPACLPVGINIPGLYGKPVTVTGWGTTSFGGSTSVTLQEVTLTLITPEECKTVYSSITTNMICAYSAGKDSCQGDSGGPLVYNDGTHSFLLGVVSYGYKCAENGYPGVYTSVVKYIPWIETQTGLSFCVPP